ncbi:hypothetical protein [Streptomyces sp. NPDC026673]|uniref:hypothetical protein n=1 Tax=Streptomyces sp. NPDC026673 TaxID=3155724 RepID=UPI0033F959D4
MRSLRQARKGEPERAGAQLLTPLRQPIESVDDTLKAGRTPGGVAVRVLRRLLALTAAGRHDHHTGRPDLRSLTACDHQSPGTGL